MNVQALYCILLLMNLQALYCTQVIINELVLTTIDCVHTRQECASHMCHLPCIVRTMTPRHVYRSYPQFQEFCKQTEKSIKLNTIENVHRKSNAWPEFAYFLAS
jgi:hypothetical protein